LLTPVEGLISN